VVTVKKFLHTDSVELQGTAGEFLWSRFSDRTKWFPRQYLDGGPTARQGSNVGGGREAGSEIEGGITSCTETSRLMHGAPSESHDIVRVGVLNYLQNDGYKDTGSATL